MNCKQGDLAIVVRSSIANSTNFGKVVRCLEFFPAGTKHEGFLLSNDSWRVDVPLSRVLTGTREFAGYAYIACDKNLIPIRDQEGEDETLTWAGKPEKVSQ